jgi:enoyl-CoA hydratase/carnithine racemase
MPDAQTAFSDILYRVEDGVAVTQPLGEAIEAANADMPASFRSEDFREGVAHFREKRPARFTGR